MPWPLASPVQSAAFTVENIRALSHTYMHTEINWLQEITSLLTHAMSYGGGQSYCDPPCLTIHSRFPCAQCKITNEGSFVHKTVDRLINPMSERNS